MQSKKIFLSLLLIASTIAFSACNKSTAKAEASATEPIAETSTASTEPITETATTSTEEAETAYTRAERTMQVSDALSELCKSTEFKNADEGKKAELALKVLKDFEIKGILKKDSIIYYKESRQIGFEYIDGIHSAFMLYSHDSRYN